MLNLIVLSFLAKGPAKRNKINAGQKSLRRRSRKRMNPLTQNFGFSWFGGYTF